MQGNVVRQGITIGIFLFFRRRLAVEGFPFNFDTLLQLCPSTEAWNINDFISFSESGRLTAELLMEQKELDLMQFLSVQSVQFRKKN